MGNVMLTEVPLVADVALGLDDLYAAVEQLMTPALQAKAAERAVEVKKFSQQARTLRALVAKQSGMGSQPADR